MLGPSWANLEPAESHLASLGVVRIKACFCDHLPFAIGKPSNMDYMDAVPEPFGAILGPPWSHVDLAVFEGVFGGTLLVNL